MPTDALTLRLLATRLAVCRLDPDERLPEWLWRGSLWSATRTGGELSLVVAEEMVPAGWRARRGFRALEVAGPLDFALVGILADLTAALAAVRVPVLTISTYDTDLLLVSEGDLARSCRALAERGHVVVEDQAPSRS